MEVTSIGSKHPISYFMKTAAGAMNAVTNMLLTIATGLNILFINMMKILHMNAPMGGLLLDLQVHGMASTRIGNGILDAAV